MENRLLQLDQDGLAIQTVMALLPQVQSHQDDFISQGISNLLWALAKLVENELLQLDQGGLASQTVAALLRKVVTPPEPFDSRHVSNLLWALAKLVEDERLQQDQGGFGQPGDDDTVAASAEPSERFYFPRCLQPAVGAGKAGGERTTPAGSGSSGQTYGDGAVAEDSDPAGTV